VARDADGEHESWKIKLLIFVRATSRSVNVKTFNDDMQELQVIESKRNAIRKGLAFELLNAQDAVLCSYFVQRAEARGDCQVQVGNGTEVGHLQSQPYLSERADKSGGEEKIEKVVIQGLINPESRTCDGNLSRAPDPV
jgi:hypothetical protein